MAFAENLRRLRLEQFLSQAELARRARLHPLTITRLEAGATAPSTRTVRALAQALGVEPRARPGGDVGRRLDSWEDDGGAAQPEASGRADWPRGPQRRARAGFASTA